MRCMYCTKPLGVNEVVETFPVGRRLAFDAARGRLWVVCTRCERWNLTPLEERWEAVETCERIFRDTRVRVSTENIGIARHPEGLTLVRIGEPLRPEFAAWRYGDQFGRRRRKHILYGAAGKRKKKTWFEGTEALRFAGAILPRMNETGGTRQTVQRAVDRIEAAGHPERFLVDIAGLNLYHAKYGEPGCLSKMPQATRLAVEMALHEEQERRALEGELWLLERAWMEAEEIAEISDSLLLPQGTEDFIREHGER